MSVEITGNYRVYKKKTGISGAKTELATGTESEIDDFMRNTKTTFEVDGCKLFKEEEVIYKNSIKDESGRFVDSAPTWRVKLF